MFVEKRRALTNSKVVIERFADRLAGVATSAEQRFFLAHPLLFVVCHPSKASSVF